MKSPCLLLALVLAQSIFLRPHCHAADPPICTGAWTLVHIPDTQNYVKSSSLASIFTEETQWIVAQKTVRNIRFAVQVGDLTDDNDDVQWDRARTSLDVLQNHVSFSTCTGNHDCGPGGSGQTHSSQFSLSTRCGMGSPYQLQSTFGGYFHHPNDAAGNTQNSWHSFKVGRQDFLVLTCEWGPRNQVVAWMESIVAARPHHRAILVLHAYLENGSARFNWSTSQSGSNPHATDLHNDPDGTNDGEELWTKLVSIYENFCLVCCGHAGMGFRTAMGNHGNTVNEMLYNTQSLANGGDGWLRLLEFFPDGNTVHVRTYSPYRDEWDTSANDDFYFSISPVSTQDTDSDGLPDYYETQHNLSPTNATDATKDTDNDGENNLHEYQAATDPLNPNSVFRAISLVKSAPDTFQVTWTSVPGNSYQLQSKTNLGTGTWTDVGSVIIATQFQTTSTSTLTGTMKFLRVKIAGE